MSYRSARLAYLYRALEYEQLLSPEQRERLGCSVSRHARWIHDNANYKYANNHGLYQDAALFVVATQLNRHTEADAWRARATERFVENVNTTVSTLDGLHLEHSPVYHILITELLEELIYGIGLKAVGLPELHQKMREVAPWLIMPDGRYPQLGDTNLRPAPSWAAEKQAEHQGFAVFPHAGAAVYRDAASYFMSVAWYHSRAHKHSDELSFVWAEAGRRVIVDSGRYGYFYDEPGRIYAESSRAHNTLTLDPPFAWSDHVPYGSGIVDTASDGEWYAVLAKNPLLARDHRRVFAYRPGRWLVIVDQLATYPALGQCPASTRRFHLAPSMQVVATTDDAVHAADDVGSVWLQTAPAPAALWTVTGQQEPEIQGYTFPSDRSWVESTAVELVDNLCGVPMVTVFSVGADRPVVSTTRKENSVELQLEGELVSLDFGDALILTAQ